MKRQMLSLTSLLAVVVIWGTSSFAQVSSTGSLAGSVADPRGAVIPGATVKVKETATNQEFAAVTNSEGSFTIPSLNPGVYSANITAQGFKQAVVTDIKIDAGKASTIQVSLEVGSTTETVTVSGGTAELIQTQSSTISTTLVGRQITDIPTASRDALDLVLTMPGTQTPGRPRTSTVNGLPKGSLNISLDGVNVQDNLLKSSDGYFTYIRPRTDAIDEVTVSTSNPGAESAAEGAVQIKFVTKGGTNEYHGGLYWYHRNPSLNANYWFNNALLPPDPRTGSAPRTRILLNQPGGKIGGPIIIPKLFNGRDRAFFFVNYEEFRLPEATLRQRTVLTDTAQSGVFSYPTSSGVRTVNLYQLAAANGQTATPDPRVGALLAQIHQAVSGTGLQTTSDPNYLNASFVNTGIQIRKFPTVRLDFNLTKNHHLENIWNYQQFRSAVDFLNGVDPAFPGFPNHGSQDSNRFSNTTALRSTLRTTLVNEARFGLTGGTVLFFPQVNTGQFQNQGGFNLGIGGIGGVGGAGISSATVTVGNSRRNAPVKQFNDNLTWIKGAHNVTFGGSFTHVNLFSQSVSQVVQNMTLNMVEQDPAFRMFDTAGAGRANFPGATDAQISQAANIYATLTGRVTSVGGSVFADEKSGNFKYLGDFVQRASQSEFGVYAQDTWRYRPNITLTYGLRWEVQRPYRNTNLNYSLNTFADLFGVTGTGNIFKPGTLTGSTTLFRAMPDGTAAYNTDWTNFAPSLGITYSPNWQNGWLKRIFGDGGQTVFRGGFSMAYNREGLNTFLSINGSNPGGFLDASLSTDRGNLAPGTLLRSGSPLTGPFAPPPFPSSPTFPLSPTVFDSANAFLPDLRPGYIESWTFGIQRELTKDTVFEARYVGNRAHGLWRQYDLNETDATFNKFVDEFKLAQANLLANIAAGRGANFRYFGAGTGTFPLPILVAHFAGLPASAAGDPANYRSSFFARSGFVAALNPLAPSVASFAGSLGSRSNYSAFPWHSNMLKAGLPANFWVVNPDVSGSFIVDNGGQTWYDALTLEVRRRLSKGLLLEANYTFSKSETNMFASSSVVFSQYPSLHNTHGAKTNSPFDIRHAFKTNFIWELPVGRGRRFLATSNGVFDRLVGGWGVNGSIRVQSGTPFNLGHVQLVGMSVSQLQDMVKIRKTSFDPITQQPATVVFYLPQSVIDNTRKAFNVAVTSNGPAYTLGAPSGQFIAPAGYGNCIEAFNGQCALTNIVLHGPRFVRADLSLVKRIRIRETMNFELRGEFLNAFNNIDFKVGNPSNDVTNIGGFGGTGFGRTSFAYQDLSTTNDPGGRLVQIVARFNF